MYLMCESFVKEKGENAMVIAGIDIGMNVEVRPSDIAAPFCSLTAAR